MKKSNEQEPKGFDVFKTASAVIGSTFGKVPERTWLPKPVAKQVKRTAPRKKAVKAASAKVRAKRKGS